MKYRIVKLNNYLVALDESRGPQLEIAAHLPLINAQPMEGVDRLPTISLASEESTLEKTVKRIFENINFPEEKMHYFLKGYYHAKDNLGYSKEDLRKALEYGYEKGKKGDFTREQEESFYKSLRGPKTPVGFDRIDIKNGVWVGDWIY